MVTAAVIAWGIAAAVALINSFVCAMRWTKAREQLDALESRVESATFVPPCAHQWRKVAEAVVPPIVHNGFSARGLSSWELRCMLSDQTEAAQGSTVLVLACDKCGETQTETVKGAPRV